MTKEETQQLLQRSANDDAFEAQERPFRTMYYSITWIQLLLVFIFVLTHTACVFAYDWAMRHGVQPRKEELRGDRKRWSLICTAASAGISSYWSATSYFLLLFALRQVEDFR
jgi:amino acid transporter